jgi:nucleotide-binding universal stress UspA family protein
VSAQSPYRAIACCLDDSPASVTAMRQAAALAELIGARLMAVHVMPDADTFTGGQTAWSAPKETLAGDLLEEGRNWVLSRALEGGAPHAEPIVLFGDPPSAVCEWAEGSDCDLLVAAAHREGFVRAILGHFTTHLARNAPCPVLVVRGRTAG